MDIHALADLGLDQAWARARHSDKSSGIPDRLPLEVFARLRASGGPAAAAASFATPYSPGTPVLVFGPKESRTLRPFVALPPLDGVLYQALVDLCAPQLEAAIPPEDVVYQFRPVATGLTTFSDRPKWPDFLEAIRTRLGERGGYLLETDIAGFFLHVRPHKVVHGLLALGAPESAARDVETLLEHFQVHGVEGLPQGSDASSALSNLALRSLDALLTDRGLEYVRWSDDIRVFCPTFREALAAQELIERHLYAEGFSLAAGKTFIRRADTALARLENLESSLEAIRDSRIRDAMADNGPYDAEDIDVDSVVEEAELGAAEEFYEQVAAPIRDGRRSADPLFHSKLAFALRMLGQLGSAIATDDAPALSLRHPDQIAAIASYLRRLARRHRDEVIGALGNLHRGAQYAVEYQRLAIASAAASLAAAGPVPALANPFAAIAADTEANAVLRRRAGLAAVALSARNDGALATSLWDAFDGLPDPPLSKLYLVLGAALLDATTRGALYSRWTGESRLLTSAIDGIATGGSTYDLGRI